MCVIVDGHTVVDLVGGWTDGQRTTPWSPETLVNFYSVGKAIVALLALRLVDQGLVGLDDPVVSVWPEFGQAGKQQVTVRQVLCHRAGVPAIRQPLTNSDLWHCPGSFGHFGTGGAVGFADPRSGVAFGYVMNDVIPRWQSTRNRALIAALYDSF